MFQSIRYIRSLGYNSRGQYLYEYEITDSEFGPINGEGLSSESGAGACVGEVVIRIYEDKGLSVPENFARYIQYIHKTYEECLYTTNWMIAHHSLHNKLFPKYKEGVLDILFPWRLYPILTEEARASNEALEVLLDQLEEKKGLTGAQREEMKLLFKQVKEFDSVAEKGFIKRA